MSRVVGFDVGGANLKAAAFAKGRVTTWERPFALWRDPRRLAVELRALGRRVGVAPEIAVTMTAELADCFATKREGVRHVLHALAGAFPRASLRVFALDGRFLSVEEARRRPMLVAASNWMATALVVARAHGDAFLVDVGSTTTDVTPIVGGRVAARGKTDTARLATGELVYTGILRTPVSAILRTVDLAGRPHRVAAEHFAIAADAHLWRRALSPTEYTCDTADGRGRTRGEAAARLARMVCADASRIGAAGVARIASAVAEAQALDIAAALRQVRRQLGTRAPTGAVVVGAGAVLGREAARRAGLRVVRPAGPLGGRAGRCAPAAAVALLLAEALG